MEAPDLIGAIRTYIDRGAIPIPIPAHSKAPIRSDWPSFRPSVKRLVEDFGEDENVGILLGEPSGGLTDIDLDCDEAIELAPYFLPKTGWIHGRLSKARSHYWYLCEPPLRPVKYVDPDGTCLLELRSTGQQTVVPPSTHPSGERLSWHTFNVPAPVVGDTLITTTSLLAACALLARRWPAEGARQDLALALSGSLLRGGLAVDQAESLIRFAAEVAGDEESEKRAAVVSATQSRLTDDQPVQGLPTLREILGEDVVRRLTQWLSLRSPISSKDPGTAKANGATRLLALVDHAELFASEDGKPFATLPVDGHMETYPIRSSAFERYLQKSLYDKEGKAVSSTTLRDALGVLEARAQFSGVRRSTFLRVGGDDKVIYLDLGTDRWNGVRIDAEGWSIVDKLPLPFWRSPGMQALPEPKPDGQLAIFREVLNVDEDEDWYLLLAWLVAALRPVGPYPILALIGQAGSAKSTTAQLLRQSIDPALPTLRSLPRDERDLMIAANGNWVLAFDNLSGLSPSTADILCRLSTGGGYAKRLLFTNDEEMLFCAQRPIILTSIDEVATREDLLDRAIVLSLPPIPDTQRRDEQTLSRNFRGMRPYLLGKLLDGVSEALRNHRSIQLKRRPRLADFAQWVSAAETALSVPTGATFDALTENRAIAVEAGIDADVVASALIAFMEQRARWIGSATELLDALIDATSERITRQRSWPRNPSQLGNRLRRVVNILEQRGLRISFDRRADSGRARLIEIYSVKPGVQGVQGVRRRPSDQPRSTQADSADSADSEKRTLWQRLLPLTKRH